MPRLSSNVRVACPRTYNFTVSVLGQLLLGIGLVTLSSLWWLGIVQMRRAGDQSRFILPGFAMEIHLVLLFSFVAGWVVLIGGLTRL